MTEYNLPSLNNYSYKPLRMQVYEVLREAILTGKLDPGEKIIEVKIAEELNVSRTPVREAIRMLELEELIEIHPQKGIFVAGIESKKEIDNIFEVRAELEALAVRLAAANLTDQQKSQLKTHLMELETATSQQNLEKCIEVDIAFHQIIYEAADNRWLQKVLDTLFEQITRFRSQSFSRRGRMDEAFKEHQELYNALEDNDIKQAEEIVRCHIENARKNVVKIFEDMTTE